MEEILCWCRAGKVLRGHGDARDHSRTAGPLPAAILPGPIRADVLAGPLALHDDRFGVLLLVARPPAVFEPQHVELMQVLIEPFAAALENDRHVAEMAALREAAEADKRSLLNRLGRRDKLGDTIVGVGSGLRFGHGPRGVGLQVPTCRCSSSARPEQARRSLPGRSTTARPAPAAVHPRELRRDPEELIESQRFGHERARSPARPRSDKAVRRADGGTLLLDEMAEMPLAAQVRLLRILQDGWLDRVGGHRPNSVNVRIVAATHRDLPGMVPRASSARPWYRLAVIPIAIPPLRERLEDIPELARHFAAGGHEDRAFRPNRPRRTSIC